MNTLSYCTNTHRSDQFPMYQCNYQGGTPALLEMSLHTPPYNKKTVPRTYCSIIGLSSLGVFFRILCTEPQFVISDADIVRHSEIHHLPLPSQDRAFELNLCLCASDLFCAIAARGSIFTLCFNFYHLYFINFCAIAAHGFIFTLSTFIICIPY